MKIYISGQITGIPLLRAKEKFKLMSAFLELKGYEPINPFDILPPHKNHTWIDYMVADIRELMGCEAIYMLPCWGKSKGARIEYQIAKEMGLIIIHHGEFQE